jgi:hypothetical protein
VSGTPQISGTPYIDVDKSYDSVHAHDDKFSDEVPHLESFKLSEETSELLVTPEPDVSEPR